MLRNLCLMVAAASVITVSIVNVVAGAEFDFDSVNPNDLRWEQKSSLPIQSTSAGGVHHPITFANATHGFMLSGTTLTSSYTTMFYMYEADTDTWTDLSSTSYAFPGTARSFGYGVASQYDCGNTKAYVGFGAAANNQQLQDLWEFDMSTGRWTQLADLPGEGRLHPAMNYVEEFNQIHVGLGNGNGGNYNDWWSYSIPTNTWTQLPSFPSTPRHHPYHFVIGSDSYVGFGHSNSNIERDWYKWDTPRGRWLSVGDFVSYPLGGSSSSLSPSTTEARVAGTQFSVTNNNNNNNGSGGSSCDTTNAAAAAAATLGFVLSGDGSNHGSMPTGELHAFDPSVSSDSRQWRELPSHPGASRWAPNSFVLQGSTRVYMIGGVDRQSETLHGDMWSMELQSMFATSLPREEEPTPKPSPCTNSQGKFQKDPLKENTVSCTTLKNKKKSVQKNWCTKYIAVQTNCPSICNKECRSTCTNQSTIDFQVEGANTEMYRCNTITKNRNKKRKFCNKRTTTSTNRQRVKELCPKRCGVCSV